MTPQEKAIDLVDKFYQHTNTNSKERAKACALIAVDEMIKEVYNISHQYTALYLVVSKSYYYEESKELKFWQEVKKEIEKL